jgi:hypothetical protein
MLFYKDGKCFFCYVQKTIGLGTFYVNGLSHLPSEEARNSENST